MEPTRVILIVIDACGIGELPDASLYGDCGAATIPNIAAITVNGLRMPTCQMLGFGNIVDISGVPTAHPCTGCYGKMAERAVGKDSISGHWEMGGVILSEALPLFPHGFPKKLVREFEHRANVKTIGNMAASGTEIIEQLGQNHLETGKLILYTSADSVFQLAAHEHRYPLDRLYDICRIARDLLQGEYAVGRVIARPFIGKPGDFTRTAGRRDFSLEPPSDTILDLLVKSEYKVLSIGKIYDLFAGRGITTSIKTTDNADVIQNIIETVKNDKTHHLVASNLVDFDQLWGHRNDVRGFAKGLEDFDRGLTKLLPLLREKDILIITADHGCDPTLTNSTDHTREYVPLLVYGENIKGAVQLGTRDTFADIACTIAELFDLRHDFPGQSFLSLIKKETA